MRANEFITEWFGSRLKKPADSGRAHRDGIDLEIFGDGAGATAVATVVDGEVTAIDVITGGSGYRPNPPTMTEAVVTITTGRVENLLYR